LKTPTDFQDLGQFLFENVATYDELEVLLLLHREPERDWTIDATAPALGLQAEACQAALQTLAAHGLLVLGRRPATFRYAPASQPLDEATERLQRAYTEDRFTIVQIMTTNAMNRVRAAALDRLGGAIQLRDGRKSR